MSINKAAFTIAIPAVLLAFLSAQGCDDSTGPGEPDTVTVVFRDGESPVPTYLGTADAVIRNGPTYEMRSGNYGNRSVDTLGITELAGAPYERRLLVRFDLTSITDCGSVESAALTLHITPEDTGTTIRLEAYESTVPPPYPGSWVEGFVDPDVGVTWLTVDGVTPWESEGGDVLSLIDAAVVKSDSAMTFELDPAVVGRWIEAPSLNHGILVVPAPSLSEEAYLFVHMREGPRDLRPELVIRYIKGG
jgi:hypothetical protein